MARSPGKEVTTSGAERARARRRERAAAKEREVAPPWEEVDAKGRFDGDLVELALSPRDGHAQQASALRELERRHGWRAAAELLSEQGAAGASVAQQTWGRWLEGGRRPARLVSAQASLSAPPSGGEPLPEALAAAVAALSGVSMDGVM